MRKSLPTQSKIGLGAALATLGVLLIVLSLLLGWTEAPSVWDFLAGFAVGLITGLGATLVVAGLVERNRAH